MEGNILKYWKRTAAGMTKILFNKAVNTISGLLNSGIETTYMINIGKIKMTIRDINTNLKLIIGR